MKEITLQPIEDTIKIRCVSYPEDCIFGIYSSEDRKSSIHAAITAPEAKRLVALLNEFIEKEEVESKKNQEAFLLRK